MSRPASNPVEEPLPEFDLAADIRLAGLELTGLLDALLDRTRARLGVDTAAVLLTDDSGTFLAARAARGVEAEVYQGVRIPMGQGFAGRVAASRTPVIVDDLDAEPVLNPILRSTGIRSLLGVPLMDGDRVLGVLHVGSMAGRRFTLAEAGLLSRIGERVAEGVRTRITQAERAAAGALQRSLWPTDLPIVPGLEFAARYVPGGNGDMGGDWYDVFAVPSGDVWIVMGDVVGRGLPAAVAMGRLRSALRAYAMEADGPADLLRRLSRHIQHFQPELMATVLCAVLDPEGDRIRLSSAGHPPPILWARPGLPAVALDLPIDLPMGVDRARTRHTTSMALPPGAAVCFYTDGLVERRDRPIGDGIELLRTTEYTGRAEPLCAAVMGALVGTEPATDDVAVLVVRRAGADDLGPLDLRLPAVPATLQPLRRTVKRWLVEVGHSPEGITDLVLAVCEAATNVIEHAYGPAGGEFTVRLALDGPDIVATVGDDGRWRAARGKYRGRGLIMMEGLVDRVCVERTPVGTTVVLRTALREEAP
jgi:anti-sigma regulatory factor (Ser/Thr protein kinase)